jgi:hypothetical protein
MRVITENIVTAARSASIAVASTAVVYTRHFRLGDSETFSLLYQATSASGAPDVTIELQESDTVPTTEGADDANWFEHEGVGDVAVNLTAETPNKKDVYPVTSKFGRLKITGNAGNTADAIVTAKLSKQVDP